MEENKKQRISFFTRLKWAICNVENYDFFAVEKSGKALSYFIKLILLFSILICLGLTYQFARDYQNVMNYIETQMPNFKYEDGNFFVEQEEAILQENEQGTVMIDTKVTADSEEGRELAKKIQMYQTGILLLKDKVILKLPVSEEITTYSYQEITNKWQVEKFTKEEAVSYIKSIPTILVYGTFYITAVFYLFMVYCLVTAMDVILLSLLGALTSRMVRIKLRFAPIVNISVYALTLPILLNALYIIVNTITGFTIQYFQIMYNAISYIYLITAILMIKSEMIKQEIELIKLAEEQKKVKEELERQKEEEREKEEQRKKEKEDEKKRQQEEKKDNGEEPEGSSAISS